MGRYPPGGEELGRLLGTWVSGVPLFSYGPNINIIKNKKSPFSSRGQENKALFSPEFRLKESKSLKIVKQDGDDIVRLLLLLVFNWGIINNALDNSRINKPSLENIFCISD